MSKSKETNQQFDTFQEGGDSNLMIDMNNIEAAEFKPLTPGTYAGVITNTEFKQSKNGSNMWSITVTVDATDSNGEQVKRKLFDNFVFTQAAMPFVKQRLIIINNDLANKDNLDIGEDHAVLLNTSVMVVVAQSEYNGTMQNNIKRYVPVNSGGF